MSAVGGFRRGHGSDRVRMVDGAVALEQRKQKAELQKMVSEIRKNEGLRASGQTRFRLGPAFFYLRTL